MSLFGGGVGAASAQPRTRNLIEFKAGKMNLRGTMVYPDKRKGLVYLYQGNDLLMHLCWKDRTNNTVIDDLVIFPDEIEFKKVIRNTTGRVYVLKWKSNNRKLFFWMQEPKEDKDEEFCKKINHLLNHPPVPDFDDDDDDSGASSSNPLRPLMERMGAGRGGSIDPNDLNNVLRGMDPTELASLLSSFRGNRGAAGFMQGLQRGRGSSANTTQQGTTSTNRSSAGGSSSNQRHAGTSSSASTPATMASSTTSSAPKAGPIQMSALTSVLTNLGNNSTQATEAKGNSTQATGAKGNSTQATEAKDNSSKPPVDLYNLINSEHLIPLLSNKNIQDKLRIYLPEDNIIPTTEKELRESILSPQFRQIVNAFSMTLQSGELSPILIQLDFPDDVIKAASQGDLQAFVKAIEKHYQTIEEKKSSDNTMDIN